ncbi:23369_t:CDS:2, partial [Cetraspora pellucida]
DVILTLTAVLKFFAKVTKLLKGTSNADLDSSNNVFKNNVIYEDKKDERVQVN